MIPSRRNQLRIGCTATYLFFKIVFQKVVSNVDADYSSTDLIFQVWYIIPTLVLAYNRIAHQILDLCAQPSLYETLSLLNVFNDGLLVAFISKPILNAKLLNKPPSLTTVSFDIWQ